MRILQIHIAIGIAVLLFWTDQPVLGQVARIVEGQAQQTRLASSEWVRFVSPITLSAVTNARSANITTADTSQSRSPSQAENRREYKKDQDAKSQEKNEPEQRRLVAEKYGLRPVGSISLETEPTEGLKPEDYADAVFSVDPIEYHSFGFLRETIPSSVCWTAPWIAYRPLYFEDCSLERCGHDHGCWEPIVSAAKFYGRIPVWPYMIGATDPRSCTYSYGMCRPGDCSPHFFILPKRSARGAFYQAAAVTSAVFIIP